MKVLITGGTGLVGRAVVTTASPEDCLTLLHLRDYAVLEKGVTSLVADVRSHRQLADILESQPFDAVVHAAGLASVDYVEHHFEEGWESNVLGTQNVVDIVRKKGLKLVYVSTSEVFDGTRGPYKEDDPTGPVNKYGRIKVECEAIVKRLYPEAAIVRPIFMYGRPVPGGRLNQAAWVIERLRRGEKIHLVTDVRENPLWACQCGEAIWRVLRIGKAGTFHLAGQDIVSRYELARLVAQIFELDGSLIHPVDSSFFPDIAPRPHEMTFLTDRMQVELGMTPLSILEGLQRMKVQTQPIGAPCST